MIVLFFSLFFSSLGWGREIKCLTLYFLISSGSQASFEEEVLCNERFIPKDFHPSNQSPQAQWEILQRLFGRV